MRYTILAAVVILAIYTIGCDTDRVEPDFERLGSAYFPLKVGQYNIYAVQNIDYKVTGEVINANFERKSSVVDSFINQAGSVSYILYDYTRQTESDIWQFEKAYSARKDGNQAVVTDNNTSFIKLSFPVANGRTWNGNALNTLDSNLYVIDSVGFRYITPAEDTLKNTLTVIQADNQDFTVELDRRYELYALNIGLAYKEEVSLEYCTDTDCLGQQQIEEGYEYRQYLIEYGNNE